MYYAAKLKEAELCNACGTCILACPEANAINILKLDAKNKKIEINVLKCKGCGICVELCPKKAMEVALR